MSQKLKESLGCYNIINKTTITNSINRVISSDSIDYNTYTSPKGLNSLREKIASFLTKNWNYEISSKNMLITSGSQQSINLLLDALDTANKNILIEQPTYYGALSNFKKSSKILTGIEISKDGINLAKLQEALNKEHYDYIYVVPTFNNPTGYAWPKQNRIDFLNIINKYNIIVIEDDPYSLINFTNENYETLYKLNNGKNVIYLGTFSKYISPSINVGFVIASTEILNKLYIAKEDADLCTNALIQNVVADYLENYDINKIVEEKNRIYKGLLAVSLKEVNDKYKDNIKSITTPKGGLFYLVYLKEALLGVSDTHKYFINETNPVIRINICAKIE